jgi:hypothetical protein
VTTHASRARFAALAVIAVVAAGCGTDEAPADAAPELAERLERVDRAVTSGDEAQIRERVESLVDATESAQTAGQLDEDQADRILAAADALLAQLPDERPEPESPASSSPASPTPEVEEDEGDEGEDDGDHGGEGSGESGSGHDKDKGKGHGKSKGKGD